MYKPSRNYNWDNHNEGMPKMIKTIELRGIYTGCYFFRWNIHRVLFFICFVLIFCFHLFQLVDASTLKKEVAEGVDLMVVRELTGG